VSARWASGHTLFAITPASTWLRLGTPVHEVAEYLGDDPRTVLAVYAHVLGEDQGREHLRHLARGRDRGPWATPCSSPARG
jgi:hypothetical protein